MAAASDLPFETMKATAGLPPVTKTAMSDFPSSNITTTLVLPPATMRTTSVFPPAQITTTLKLPSITMTRASERGIGIGVVAIVCLLIVAICCFILWRRKLHRNQNRERLNTYRNAEDISITSNQNVQIQGNLVSYTELTVYNHNHAYDELQKETKNTLNEKTELLDNFDGLSNDNYTVLVVPEDRNEGINSTLMANTTWFMDNTPDNKDLNQTNTSTGAYAILDPRETGFDRPKPEQKVKADSFAVLGPAETGFDRTKYRNDVTIQSLKHENLDNSMQEHDSKNKETGDEMENQNEGPHSITKTNKIESIENKAPKKTNISIGAYVILDPDATGFDRTKPEPEGNDDSYTVLDPAETGFDRTKDREHMPSQSIKVKNSGKSVQEHAIQNHEISREGKYSLNEIGQYDVLNQVLRPNNDNEHTYSHSVDAVYDTTNQNRTSWAEDSSHAYDQY
ncbi:uncharacterized protein LOC134726482 [Mytilus trossulus]|uniref:uncharacterized protein LOC134726482 n=1 Tax=Mytilus trossulus TaxID=6551 RepID=UPI003003E350